MNKKGAGGWNKGISMSEETKKRISLAKTGKKYGKQSKKHLENRIKALTGRKHPRTKEWQDKITNALKGRVAWNYCEDSFIYCANCDKKVHKKPTEINDNGYNFCSRKCSSEFKVGENNPNWKGGLVSENNKIRASNEYAEWRFKVFERDNFTCRDCGAKKGLNAHHIKEFSKYPKLRMDLDNGLTLCIDCHEKVHGRPIFKGTMQKLSELKAKNSFIGE